MRTLAATAVLVLALAGCGASDEEMQAAVRAAEKPLGEQLAGADQELERLRKDLRASEREVRTADARAKAAAEQAIAPQEAALAQQTAAIRALEASLKQKETALAAREQAVGVAEAQVAANTIDGDGTFLVGDDVQPGTYKSAGGTTATGLGSVPGAARSSTTTSGPVRRS
jgi:multidrug resistance efflux pump